MSIFNKDRIRASVFCKVVHGSKQRGEIFDHGYVKWVLAKKGQVVNSLEVPGYGRVKGPWIVEAVDVPFTA